MFYMKYRKGKDVQRHLDHCGIKFVNNHTTL